MESPQMNPAVLLSPLQRALAFSPVMNRQLAIIAGPIGLIRFSPVFADPKGFENP
jgi:hypothetical protein